MLYLEELSGAVADVCEQWIVQERGAEAAPHR